MTAAADAKITISADTGLMLGHGLRMAASQIRQSVREINSTDARTADARTLERLTDVVELLAGLGDDFVARAKELGA